MKNSLLFLVALCFINLSAQPTATPASELQNALQVKAEMDAKSLVKNLPLKNIGPTVMSGRVTDLAVNVSRPEEFYVAYASGGLWYTNNNGISFTPVMDNSASQNIGDIAVDWKSGTIWVGTGENNSSRSSYAGIGMLRSADKGNSWEEAGLADAHHIGRILLKPDDPNTAVVGVTGHLYSPNSTRGVYKTSDGGKTWKQTLFINDSTGIIDMAHVPGNYNIQYASAWEKDRKAWNFKGNGPASGIYKSVDGGETWNLVSNKASGFPVGSGVGRIGLAVFNKDIVYAVHDSQFRREKKPGPEKKGLNKEQFKTMDKSSFLELDDKKLEQFLRDNRFPEKYTAASVKQLVRKEKAQPIDLARYLEDANTLLFDTPVVGAEVYKSTDGGITWQKMNSDYIDDLYFSYGYYFGQINVDPRDPNKIYLGGVPIIRSDDGGKTFTSIQGDNVHADHHALWINPLRQGHLINGNDGGLNISYDDGANWMKNNSTTVGQFYSISVDDQKPYNVYGGLQDNGVWMGPHNASESTRWHQTGHYSWKSIMGGDGMQTQIDSRNPNIVYTGYQFGNYFRVDIAAEKRDYIQPKHELGEDPFRFNWQTPILLSKHNQDILYLGSNRLHRSLNQGTDWESISDDLTQGGKKGNVSYGTLTTISESPFKFGLLYTGSDDGYIHVSKNAGGSWDRISGTLPQDLWVSRVVASAHEKSRVYASLNGYRWDDFNSYIYKSEDYGKTWTSIGNGIPASPVNVIVEDPANENLLFAGTDNGLYASMDQGRSWQSMSNGLPAVAVHDLVIQANAKHLLVGTHGRSIYKADISHLQQLTNEILAKDLYVFKPGNIRYSQRWGNAFWSWGEPNTPGMDLVFYSNSDRQLNARVITPDKVQVSTVSLNADPGINILSYDVAFDKKGLAAYRKKYKKELKKADNGKTYLPKGTYHIVLDGGTVEEKVEFKIE